MDLGWLPAVEALMRQVRQATLGPLIEHDVLIRSQREHLNAPLKIGKCSNVRLTSVNTYF